MLGNFDPAKGLIQAKVSGVSGLTIGSQELRTALRLCVGCVGQRPHAVVRAGGGITYETLNWESFLALNNSLGLANRADRSADRLHWNYFRRQHCSWSPVLPGGTLDWNGTVFGSNPVGCDPVAGAPCTIMGVDRNPQDSVLFLRGR